MRTEWAIDELKSKAKNVCNFDGCLLLSFKEEIEIDENPVDAEFEIDCESDVPVITLMALGEEAEINLEKISDTHHLWDKIEAELSWISRRAHELATVGY